MILALTRNCGFSTGPKKTDISSARGCPVGQKLVMETSDALGADVTGNDSWNGRSRDKAKL